MRSITLVLVVFLHLFVAEFFPVHCADPGAQNIAFTASIDARRTLRVEGTDASDSIIAEVIVGPGSRPGGGSATLAIEYRRTDGTGTPQKASFRLNAFDRLVVNARGGADFVNIIDAARMLDSQKKILNLDGGEGDNIVVLSHHPFKPETAGQIKQLLDLSRQIDELAKRAGAATSQALTNEAMKLIDSVRVNIAGVSRALADGAERQLVGAANELVERQGPRSTDLGNSIIAKSDDLARQHAALVAELTKKYGPVSDSLQPDGDGDANPPSPRPDADRPETDPVKEKEAADVRARAERLAQAGLKLGDDARAQVEQMGRQMGSDATSIEQQAAEFEKRAEQLSAKAELIAASGEKDMTVAAERVLAIVAELRSVERSFREVGTALRDELPGAVSRTVEDRAKSAAAAGASGCNSPVATTHTYTGGSGSDLFFPISSPSQGWSISGGAGNDLLFGGFAADDIHGGPGADVISGLKENDHIHGDGGTDILFGEFLIDFPSLTGDDCIWGDDGVDLVVGDNFIETQSGTAGGDDSLWGGNGIDIVIGDDVLPDIFSQTQLGGKDAIEGSNGIDLLFGTGGDDDIKGNDDIDFAEGNGGNDVIDGGDGRNFSLCNTTIELGNLLLGGDGNDDVTGGAGIDVIFGNDDNDKLTGKGQVDLMFGGDGLDQMFGDVGGVICVVNGVPIRLGNLMLGGPRDDKMWSGGDLDVMLGQDGNDDIHGYDGSLQPPAAIDADVLLGGDGNDSMEGDNEAGTLVLSLDFMFGGAGNDDMHGGKSIDFMFGRPGSDRMHGDSNALLLVGSIDLMFGGPDEDWMDGGNSLDLMFGQGGNDTMLGDDETAGLISPDLLFGGPGNDTMNGGSSIDFMFGENGADHMLGDSNYLWEPLSVDFMWGAMGPDDMDGGNSLDFMWGGSDCDTMLGDNSTPVRLSPDFMFGQAGNDDMDGGNTTDFMWAGDDNDKMFGDRQLGQPLSVDFMWGEDGYDSMSGGQALDFMWGGQGVDQMDGQLGPDMMFGDANSDVINGGDLLDFIWGKDGNDLIHGDDWPDFILGGSGDDCLYGDDGQDFVLGDEGRDCIHGGSHSDFLFGKDGDDLILGDNGVDALFGGSGNDKLDGGASFDVIFGGSGNDEGWRGPGSAVFFSVDNKHTGSSGLDCDCRIESRTGKICVHKFNDVNGDGVQNNGEPGLQSWSFEVTASCVSETLITDANGTICGDFFPGTYTVVEQVQSGWTATTPPTQTIPVTAGQTTDVYFGNKRKVEPSLKLEKTVTSLPSPLQIGSVIEYEVKLTNVGTATAFDMKLTDTLPSCLELVPGSIVVLRRPGVTGAVLASSNSSGFVVTVNVAPVTPLLPPELYFSVKVRFKAKIRCLDCLKTTNSATVTWTSLPGVGVNGYSLTATAVVPPLCGPDLTIEKRCGLFEGRFACTLVVTNVGVLPAAPPITVKDTLPPGVPFIPSPQTSGGWTCVGNQLQPVETFTCTYAGGIAAGASQTIALQSGVAVPALSQERENCAQVYVGGDGNPGNDKTCVRCCVPNEAVELRYLDDVDCKSAAALNRCDTGEILYVDACGCACIPKGEPDLTLGKTCTDGPGANVVTCEFHVKNVGSRIGGFFSVEDLLPPGLQFQSGPTGGNWTCTPDPDASYPEIISCKTSQRLRPGELAEPLKITFSGKLPESGNCGEVKTYNDVNPTNNLGCTTCPDPTDSTVHYVSQDAASCAKILTGPLHVVPCGPRQVWFSNECGCGCVPGGRSPGDFRPGGM